MRSAAPHRASAVSPPTGGPAHARIDVGKRLALAVADDEAGLSFPRMSKGVGIPRVLLFSLGFMAQFVAPVLSITFPGAKQISIRPKGIQWRDEMRTLNLCAALLCPARWSYWSQSDRALPTPVDFYKDSIKPFATGPVFVQPPSPPFWRH